MDSLTVLNFGSQTSQLIARRIREAQVYCELFPFDAAPEEVLALHPKGIILSGGPASVYDPGAPRLPAYVSQSGLPVLGICYGMQLMTHALGGRVAGSNEREYGPAVVEVVQANPHLVPAGTKCGCPTGIASNRRRRDSRSWRRRPTPLAPP